MSENEVNEIFESCNRSLNAFAVQLLRKYFHKQELVEVCKYVSTSGRGLENNFDSLDRGARRFDYIKAHVEKRIQTCKRRSREQEWIMCKKAIAHKIKRLAC